MLDSKDLDRFLSHIWITDTCWLWTSNCNYKGYGLFKLKLQNRSTHRLSFEIFNGDIPPDMQVCHICDNPTCVNPDHFFLGTSSDNRRDAFAKGRAFIPDNNGDNSPVRKLNSAQVLEIYASSKNSRELADQYGVIVAVIQGIWAGRSWKIVTGGIRKPGSGRRKPG